MSDAVRIKSYPNGLRLQMDPEVSFEEIYARAEELFTSSRSFFKEAAIALSFSGRRLTEEEEDRLVSLIERETELHVLVIYEENPEREQMNVRAMSMFYLNALSSREKPAEPGSTEFHVLYGSLHAGESISVKKNVLVLGDLPAGAAVETPYNLIVTGRLLGSAEVGGKDTGTHMILAAAFEPEKLILDGKRLMNLSREPEQKSSLFRKKKAEEAGTEMKIAMTKGEEGIVIRPAAEVLQGTLPAAGFDGLNYV
ncbi:MAG: hypothetical protein J6M46_09140 [Lachnospiraceae bacterium]|nr:hypothetical protein [Lachnospiraceae bacterium]